MLKLTAAKCGKIDKSRNKIVRTHANKSRYQKK
jgi:hypothetical protein